MTQPNATNAPVANEPETAWLIESMVGWGTGNYWIGSGGYKHIILFGEIDKAVRFSRKEDAERVIAGDTRIQEAISAGMKIEATEHMWPRPSTAAKAQPIAIPSAVSEATYGPRAGNFEGRDVLTQGLQKLTAAEQSNEHPPSVDIESLRQQLQQARDRIAELERQLAIAQADDPAYVYAVDKKAEMAERIAEQDVEIARLRSQLPT